jgi:hypothetical protein
MRKIAFTAFGMVTTRPRTEILGPEEEHAEVRYLIV